MPITTSAQTLNQLDSEIQKQKDEYAKKSAELEANKADINVLTDEIKQISTDIEQTNIDIQEITNSIAKSEKKIKNLEEVEIPKTKSDLAIGLIMTQKVSNSKLALETLFSGSSDGNPMSMVRDNSMTKISDKIGQDLTSLKTMLDEVKIEKENQIKEKDNLKIESAKLEEQKAYSVKVQAELAKRSQELESQLADSQDIIEAEQNRKQMYEDAGCGPNDVYGVDCGTDQIVSAAGFTRPTRTGVVTQEFGSNSSYGTGLHSGIDIGAGGGTPIYPAASGKVLYAGPTGDGGGNSVIVLHVVSGHNYVTRYCHMSSINTSTGAQVSTSTQIGGMGATGNAYGVHLHFEMQPYSSYVWEASRFVNPRNYVSFPALGISW